MNAFSEQQFGARVPARSKHIPVSVVSLLGLSLWGLFLVPHDAHAMSFDQMKMLAGTALLDARVDAVLRDCGLPSVIADMAEVSRQRQTMRWKDVEMKLSSMQWDMVYSRQREAASHGTGWINPGLGSRACLSGLSGLVVHTKGEAGILSVKKRADNQGYVTSYLVPDNLYAAHQVIGLTGRWKQGMPASRLQEQYGKPDEILDEGDGIKNYRYWVVAKQKEMPISVHAVDFEVMQAENMCAEYTIYTSGFEFVQEKLDALQRQWERDYVLD
ncbi:MAG: hypothetical protein HY941_01505 [Gammaproteobacteria bacterium]|nr:hypothetical protein [Gammaproteobacteria bacterium]